MRRGRACVGTSAVVVCATLLAAQTAAAGEYTYSLSYSADYSDNLSLTPTDEKSGLTQVLDSGLNLSQADRDLDARLAARASYRNYQNSTFQDESTLGMDGALVWKPLPEAFQWSFNDVYTQVAANPTQADTPANRVNANVFSTGPDVFWRPNPVNTVQLGARYATNTFSDSNNTSVAASDANNTRRSGSARWFYRYSTLTTLSVAQVAESVRFENAGVGTNLDFRTNETTIGLVNRRARNVFSLDVGETRIERSGQPEVRGGLGRLMWSRELGSDSAFSLTAARGLSDTASELLAGSGSTGVSGAPLSVSSSDIFTSKTVTLLYSSGLGGGTAAFSAFRAERDFELAQTNNEDAKGANVQYSRQFSGRVSGGGSVTYTKTFFPAVMREDTDQSVTTSLQYKFTRTVIGGLTLARRTRTSTIASSDFDEDRVVLSIAYNSLPARW